MAVIEIQAKTILTTVRGTDEIFGMDYNMNLYRGCQHQCIYCDSRSLCYGIENFEDILVKANAIELLEKELPRKRKKGTIGTGSMHDPYMPIERQRNLTGQALALIARYGFGVHINTKSDLVLRDVEILRKISALHASVCLSISTADDTLSRQVEPGAPPSSRRFAAIRALKEQGISSGVCMMPVLPFLEDSVENINAIVEQAAENGADFIIPWFGMSLRDRQREYYYAHLDRLFPGLRAQYEKTYGDRYGCSARAADRLSRVFYDLCREHGIATRIPPFPKQESPGQLSLF